jgi:hypothetical protein
VAKKKNSLALFEAISRSREKQPKEGMGVPNWMGAQAPQSGQGPTATGETGPQPGGTVHSASMSSGLTASSPGPIAISLSRPAAAVIVAMFAVAVALAFLAGRMTARPAATNAGSPTVIENAGGPERGSLVDQLPARVPGKHYLVIQAMKGDSQQDHDDALKIATWLTKEKNEPAEVCQFSGGSKAYFVWSFKPFDSDKGPQAEAYAKKIEELGQQYKKLYGQYWFGQHNKGKLDPWYVKSPK